MKCVELIPGFVIKNPELTINEDETVMDISIQIVDNDGLTAKDVAKVFRQENTGLISVYDDDVPENRHEYYGFIIIEYIKTEDNTIKMEIRTGNMTECMRDLYKKFNRVNWVNTQSLSSVTSSVIQNDDLMLQLAVNDILREV